MDSSLFGFSAIDAGVSFMAIFFPAALAVGGNAIAPGVILSDRIRERMDVDAEDSLHEQISAAMTASKTLIDERHPLGYGVPEDIANVALFLASDESRMVNGAVIPAEGGAAAY